MKSKTSCFNKTIFKKNMTHFWPLWALYSCYLIVSLPVGLWFNMRYYLQDDSYSQLQRQVYAISGAMRAAMNPVITFAFAAVMIMAVFSYLYSAKNTNMIHSLPVDRRELFVTNIISAFAFMIVPQILTFIITVFVCIGAHITNIQYILYWFGAEAAMTFCTGARRICGDVYRTAPGISGVLCRSQLSVCRMLVSDQHGDRECLLWGVKQLESGKILYFVAYLLSDKQSADTVSRKQ